MGATVRRSIRVRRPLDEVASAATDPRVVLPIIGGLGRFKEISADDEGRGEWDVFIDVGSIHVGGRVVVDRPDPRRLMWHATRGTRHQLELTVADLGDDTQVSIAMSLQLAGFLTGRITEVLAAGIMGRHLDAGLQQLRHHLEYGD